MLDRTCPKCHAGLRERDATCRNCRTTVGSAGRVTTSKPQPPKRFTGDARGLRLPEAIAEPVQSPALLVREQLEQSVAQAEAEPSFAEVALSAPAATRPERKSRTPRKRKPEEAVSPSALVLELAGEPASEPVLEVAEPIDGPVMATETAASTDELDAELHLEPGETSPQDPSTPIEVAA